MPPQHGSPETTRARKLIIVSGSGRSGTSTVAGTLKKLGLAIPQPEVAADSTNPRGFFEPRWVVNFHKQLLLSAGVATLDARPGAHTKTAKVGSRPQVREELRTWLEGAMTDSQVVVKDPRTFWLKDLWHETASSLGVNTSYLTMLRHPAEVVGSRDTHYAKKQTPEARKARETGILAGWVNVVLLNEAVSRGEPRVFVHYEDLLSNWRSTMHRVSTSLDLRVNTNLTGDDPHPIDDFIDVNLRRVRLTWDDLDVPVPLRDLAENVWQGLCDLAEPGTESSSIAARMDEYRAEYNAQHAFALAFAHDATTARVRSARRQTRQAVERELLHSSSTASSGEPHTQGLASKAARKARDLANRLR